MSSDTATGGPTVLRSVLNFLTHLLRSAEYMTKKQLSLNQTVLFLHLHKKLVFSRLVGVY